MRVEVHRAGAELYPLPVAAPLRFDGKRDCLGASEGFRTNGAVARASCAEGLPGGGPQSRLTRAVLQAGRDRRPVDRKGPWGLESTFQPASTTRWSRHRPSCSSPSRSRRRRVRRSRFVAGRGVNARQPGASRAANSHEPRCAELKRSSAQAGTPNMLDIPALPGVMPVSPADRSFRPRILHS
jgi:hypothetical protein